jgi:predicted ATPase/DNA-binding CsgD family transcriptional regulator
LLGRARDLVSVRDLLTRADVRLVSLVGPGGVGKTRLALAALAGSADDFADGARWVSLASIAETTHVWPSVARALGVPDLPEGTAALEGLKHHLASLSMLLALDNLEHLIDLAPEVTVLLEACPQLKVLVTSRRALRVRAEHEFPVRPLELPDPSNAALTADVVARSDAVQLFVQRASTIRPGFVLSEGNARTLAGICARLDGLPLALELAASRLRLFTPEELLERLSAPLNALVGGPRDLSERQRSLRSTLDWSLALLEPDEQTLFARLGVFSGGFDLEAAEVIGGPGALSRLESLIEHSLLQSQDGRLFMLETIRESALEHLEQSGEVAQVREAHARHFLVLCQRAAEEIYGPNQTVWMDRLELEIDNLRVAMRWGLQFDPSLTLFIARAPYPMWNFRGRSFEAVRWIEQALELRGISVDAQAHALEKLGEHLYCVGRHEDARTRFIEALGLFRALNDHTRTVFVLTQIAKCDDTFERHEQAQGHLEEALSIARAHDLEDIIAQLSYALALNRFGRLDFVGARANALESLEHALPSASPGTLSGRYMALGMIDYMLGDTVPAREVLERAYAIALEQRNLSRMNGILQGLVTALAELGELERANALLNELRDVNLQLEPDENPMDHSWLITAAAVAVGEGRHVRAARLVGAARRLGGKDNRVTNALIDRFARKAMRALGDGWDRGVVEGQQLEVEEILLAPEPSARKQPDDLSAREFEVVTLVAEGLTDAEIAERLGIRPRTVSTHLTSVYNKFGVRSRTQAVREAQKRGLLEMA